MTLFFKMSDTTALLQEYLARNGFSYWQKLSDSMIKQLTHFIQDNLRVVSGIFGNIDKYYTESCSEGHHN